MSSSKHDSRWTLLFILFSGLCILVRHRFSPNLPSWSVGCPRTHKDELAALFPGIDVSDMLIIPTCQRAELDLVRMGPEIEGEKDRLLENFFAFAAQVCHSLREIGYWADYIDPCSGLPMIHKNTSSAYSEVQSLSLLLGYRTQNAGCCKIILHPKWGSSVYPASMFVKAPIDVVQDVIVRVESSLQQENSQGEGR